MVTLPKSVHTYLDDWAKEPMRAREVENRIARNAQGATKTPDRECNQILVSVTRLALNPETQYTHDDDNDDKNNKQDIGTV